VLYGGDWYAEGDGADTPRWAGGPLFPIRAHAWPLLLQTGGLAKIDGSKLALTPKGKKALAQPVHEVVAELYARWQKKGTPDELRRVDLIKGQTAKGVRLSAPVDRRLVIEDALHACCPVGKWLSVDDLFRQMKLDGFRFEVAGNPWKLYLLDANYGSLGYDGGDDFEILEARYTLAYLFEYLATLGLVDVAYTLPYDARPDYHDRWGTDELECLSRHAGAQAPRRRGRLPGRRRRAVPDQPARRRRRPEPDRRRLRDPHGPLVEPGRRGPGLRPRPSHRPGAPGDHLPPGREGHHRT
jgi:hypothetical protein